MMSFDLGAGLRVLLVIYAVAIVAQISNYSQLRGAYSSNSTPDIVISHGMSLFLFDNSIILSRLQ